MQKKILIVDDDIDTLQLVGTMLEKQGFKILAANSGEKAIKMAESQPPDLIILDVMMPGMDGYEVTRRLRALEKTGFIPIILFTAKAQVDDKVEGFESGADDYLTKPTHPTELIARVNTILNRPKTENQGTKETENVAERGQVIGILAAKGGLGVSTMALNMAVSIHKQTGDYVTLAEFRPGQGTIGLQLGYTKSDALSMLMKMPAAEIRLKDVENQLITHGSGIQLLLSSFVPTNATYVRASGNFQSIARHLSRIAPYTVIDLGSVLHEANQKVVQECSTIMVLVEPVPTTVVQTRELIDNLINLGVDAENIKVVINNRTRLENTIPVDKVQEVVNQPIFGVITPAPEVAYQAIALHQPIVMYQPNSIVASLIIKLAQDLTLPNRMSDPWLRSTRPQQL